MLSDDKSVKKAEMLHNITLDGREKLLASGVEDVENFDDKVISMITSQGLLTVTGEELHIERLDLDIGELSVAGKINGLEYNDHNQTKTSLFSRLFG